MVKEKVVKSRISKQNFSNPNENWETLNVRVRDRQNSKRQQEQQRLQYELDKEEYLQKPFSFSVQQIVGLAIIVITLLICYSGIMYDPIMQSNDCTFVLITIPLGLFITFA